MIDWTPIVFVTFKALVLSIGMFFAIKWHYDQGKKDKDKAKQNRAVLRASSKVIGVFVLSLLALGIVTFVVVSMVGLDMTLPGG
jgi:mannose/fructose/N-acetylgalactosamine-specific phosphotransferase system component IID